MLHVHDVFSHYVYKNMIPGRGCILMFVLFVVCVCIYHDVESLIVPILYIVPVIISSRYCIETQERSRNYVTLKSKCSHRPFSSNFSMTGG